jgi:UDP-N-acetylenolpyruvoylglucosamine reductase
MLSLLKQNVDITHLSNYKTPAKAKWYFEIHSEEDIENLYKIVQWAKKEDLGMLWIS